MKKLLAILVITLLAIPMFAGTDILNFMWFNNKIGGSWSDNWNTANKDSNNDDARVRQWQYYGFLEQFMCGMWGTAYDGDPVKLKMDFFNYFSAELGDWGTNGTFTLNEQIRFKGVMDVGSVYTLAIGVAQIAQIRPFANISGNECAWRFMRTHFIIENSIRIPNIMNIEIDFSPQLSWLYPGTMGWAENSQYTGPFTNLDLDFFVGLSGSYSFGFSWSLGQEIEIGLDLEKYKDNKTGGPVGEVDPSDGLKYDDTIIRNKLENNFFRGVPLFRTTLNLSQDILSLVGVKDVSLKVSTAFLFDIQKPYTTGWELNTLIETESVTGVTIGFYGFSIGMFLTHATQDTYNTSVGYNASMGSATTDAQYFSGPRPWGRAQLGMMLNVGYSRGFFGFDLSYHGQGQVRDYDALRDNFGSVFSSEYGLTVDNGGLFRNTNGYYRWANTISVSINFSW